MSIENLINDLKDGNNVEANKSFDKIMADKVTATLDAKKIEIASGMITRKQADTEEE